MQRLFSMFPHGAPGVALALLRVGAAAAVLTGTGIGPLPMWAAIGLAILAVALVAGLLTPLLAGLGCVHALIALIRSGGAEPLAGGLAALVCAALTLLGPGAYSLDALLYGRRRLAVPPRWRR